MANKFKPGDVVKLKSGGPKMTVDSYTMALLDEPKKVHCSWFDGNKLGTGTFPEDGLIPAEDDKDKK